MSVLEEERPRVRRSPEAQVRRLERLVAYREQALRRGRRPVYRRLRAELLREAEWMLRRARRRLSETDSNPDGGTAT